MLLWWSWLWLWWRREGRERRRGETNRTIWLLIPARAFLKIAETEQLHQVNRMIGESGTCCSRSIFKLIMCKSQGEPLGQVITLRGQILVSRTGDDTLRVLCCVLCVVCLVGVQCVGVGVCVCWCWCWFVTLTSPPSPSLPLPPTHARTHPPLSPCVRSKRHPCAHSNVPVCTGTTPASVTTRWRGASTHGTF